MEAKPKPPASRICCLHRSPSTSASTLHNWWQDTADEQAQDNVIACQLFWSSSVKTGLLRCSSLIVRAMGFAPWL